MFATYHFDSIDDLLIAVLQHANDHYAREPGRLSATGLSESGTLPLAHTCRRQRGRTDDATAVRAAVAAVDGLLAAALFAAEPPAAAHFQSVLDHIPRG